MSAPKTVEQAMALPEVNLRDRLFLGGGGISGDDICWFMDSDGVGKRVECIRRTIDGPDEWVKVRF